jgi:hypothetical protein
MIHYKKWQPHPVRVANTGKSHALLSYQGFQHFLGVLLNHLSSDMYYCTSHIRPGQTKPQNLTEHSGLSLTESLKI